MIFIIIVFFEVFFLLFFTIVFLYGLKPFAVNWAVAYTCWVISWINQRRPLYNKFISRIRAMFFAQLAVFILNDHPLPSCSVFPKLFLNTCSTKSCFPKNSHESISFRHVYWWPRWVHFYVLGQSLLHTSSFLVTCIWNSYAVPTFYTWMAASTPLAP